MCDRVPVNCKYLFSDLTERLFDMDSVAKKKHEEDLHSIWDTLIAVPVPGKGRLVLASTPSYSNPFFNLTEEKEMNNCHPIGLDINWFWDHPELPKGHAWIRNTLFHIASIEGKLAGLSVAPTNSNGLMAKDIYPDLDGVHALRILLNTSFGLRANGRVEWEGLRIGAIDVLAKNGERHIKELLLGRNIRDWCPGMTPWAVSKLTALHSYSAWTSSDLGSSFDLLDMCFSEPVDIARISIQAQMDLPGPAKPAELFENRAKIKKGKKGKKDKAVIIEKKIAEQFPSINIIGMTAIK